MSNGDPRVIINVYDLSIRTAKMIAGWSTVFIQSERGPMWEPTEIAAGQADKFIETFGNSVEWTTDPLACIKAIQAGANLIVIRLGHCTSVADRSTLTVLPASCLVPDRGGVPTAGSVTSSIGPFTFAPAIPGQVTGLEIGPFTIATGTNDKFYCRIKHAGVWGSYQTVTFAAGTLSAQDTADAINAGTTGINATPTGTGTLHIATSDSLDDFELAAIANDSYATLGLVEGVYTHVDGTGELKLTIDGGTEQVFEFNAVNGETGNYVLTSAQIVAQMTALTGGTLNGNNGTLTITSNTTGTTSSVQISDCAARTILGFDLTLHSGISGQAVKAWKYTLTGPGAYGNQAMIYFIDSPLNPGERMNFRRIIPGAPELYLRDLSPDPTDSLYWKTAINAADKLGQITEVDTPNPSPYNWPALNTDGIQLSGGDDGAQILTDADYVGDSSARTGFYCADSVLMPSINLFAFGTSSAVVMAAASAFVDSRVGLFYNHQTPANMTPQEAVDWRMGVPPEYTWAAFNSPSTALMFGRETVFDPVNNDQRQITANAELAAAITRTHSALDPSWSPFGIKRGKCDGVLGLDYNVGEDRAGADLLFEYGINDVRIIGSGVASYGMEGAYLWGGQTCQRVNSALQEFPVVQKIKQYQRMLLPSLLYYVHDPNDPVIWGEIDRTLRPLFRQDLLNHYIYGYALYTDAGAFFSDGVLKGATLNTADNIDQNIYRLRLLVKFVRQIFWIVMDFGVMRTGDPWSTYEAVSQLPNYINM